MTPVFADAYYWFALINPRAQAHQETTVIPAEQKWFDRGFALFAARLDKKWSLTDCISFVVMQDLGLTDALTGDRDFVQKGFRMLMTPPKS